MPRSRFALGLLLALLTLAASGAAAANAAERPTPGALYETGPTGRYLLGGHWLFRQDPHGAGLHAGWQRRASTAGWHTVSVPNAWNAGGTTTSSFLGGVGWYRRDFALPSASRAFTWLVRFESVNYRTRVWLNGVPIGGNTGAYLPFELRLADRALHRGGVNHLVVRVDSRHQPTDLPPLNTSGHGTTLRVSGGWWNYSGILREVYLRRVDEADLPVVQVLPHVSCATCPATVRVRATVRNYASSAQRIRVAGRYGSTRLDLGSVLVAAAGSRTLTGTASIAHPRLWSPASPALYHVALTASIGGRALQTWQTESGLRAVTISGGHLLLNGRPLNARGFGIHEDSLASGSAIDNATRARIMDAVRDVGATMIRAHYPLHPELLELADREGVMVWSEIPMYQLHDKYLNRASVRSAGEAMLAHSIEVNSNHPSIITWSIGNELHAKPGPGQTSYIAKAVRIAHHLDPTRPVGMAFAGHPGQGCQKAYAPLDVLGINEYFNWYPGPNGSTADPSLLSSYLDSVRRCYPAKGLLVTETGAEANRTGPPEERGTYAFQQAYANAQFSVIDKKTWLSAGLWWALQEFRVRPGWSGGNPRPQSPFHQKGVLTLTWDKKPAYFDLQRIFRATTQLGG